MTQNYFPLTFDDHNKPLIRVGLHHFSEKDVNVFKSMLSLSERWRKYEWIVSEEKSDVLFSLKPTSSDVQAPIVVAFKDRLKELRIKECIDYPIRLRVLLDIFHRVEDFLTLDDSRPTAKTDVNSHHTDAAEPHAFSKLLYDFLRQGERPPTWIVVFNKQPWFKVCEVSRKVYLYTKSEAPEYIAPDGEYTILRGSDFKIEAPAVAFSRDRWFWQLGISMSRHGLFPWMDKSSLRFRLSQWPDFGRFPHHKEHIRLAAFLTSGSLTLKALLKVTEAKQGHAHSLLNAAALLDFVSWEEPQASLAEKLSERSFLPKIYRCLRAKFNL